MSRKKKEPKAKVELRGRLLEVGYCEDWDCQILRIRVTGTPEPLVTIPVTQSVVKEFAATSLYENVSITVRAL